MKYFFVFLVFFFSGFCYPTSYTVSYESDLKDEELESELGKYGANYNSLLEGLKRLESNNRKEQLNDLINAQAIAFGEGKDVNSQLMAGFFTLLQNPDSHSNESLDQACRQFHVPSLIIRGLHYLHRYNKNRDNDLLLNATNDLRMISKRYIYWRALTHNGSLSPEKIELPELYDFEWFMMDKINNAHYSIQKKRANFVSTKRQGLYLGFLRPPYAHRFMGVKTHNNYLPSTMIKHNPLSFIDSIRSISPSLHDKVKTILPLPQDGLERRDACLTVALAGFRESLCFLLQQNQSYEISSDDIYLAYVGTFFERQNIDLDKKTHSLTSRKDFYQSLYYKGLQKNSHVPECDAGNHKLRKNPVVFELFSRAKEELAELRGQIYGLKGELNNYFSPLKLCFNAWLVQSLQQTYSIFYVNNENEENDSKSSHKKNLSYEDIHLLLEEEGNSSQRSNQLKQNSLRQEQNYTSHPVIYSLVSRGCATPTASSEIDLEAQNFEKKRSFFSICYNWVTSNPKKAVACALIGAAVFASAAIASHNSTGSETFRDNSGEPAAPTLSCRPFTGYDKVGTLIFNDGLESYSVSDHSASNEQKEWNQVQEVLAKALPEDVNLIVYTIANITNDIKNKFEPIVGKDRLSIIKIEEPVEKRLWARDTLPYPIFDSTVKEGFKLVSSPSYCRGNEKDGNWFTQGHLFSNHMNVSLIAQGTPFLGGNLLADDRGNCFLGQHGLVRWVSNAETLFVNPRYYCCQKLVRLGDIEKQEPIDKLLKLIDSKNVLIDQPNYQKELENAGYKVTLIPRSKETNYTYLNSLIINGKVFVPVYGQETDQQVIDIYKSFGLEVLPLNNSHFSNDPGEIHAMTMTYPPPHTQD